MKKAVLAFGMAAFAFSLSAAPISESDQRVGRCVYDDTQYSVPEATSTLGLAAIGFACLGFASMALNRKK
jgi:hypothetical protein